MGNAHAYFIKNWDMSVILDDNGNLGNWYYGPPDEDNELFSDPNHGRAEELTAWMDDSDEENRPFIGEIYRKEAGNSEVFYVAIDGGGAPDTVLFSVNANKQIYPAISPEVRKLLSESDDPFADYLLNAPVAS